MQTFTKVRFSLQPLRQLHDSVYYLYMLVYVVSEKICRYYALL